MSKTKFKDGTLSKAPSTRAIIDWIHYSLAWEPFLAFELTIANRYGAGVSDEDLQLLMRIARGKGVDKWILPKNLQLKKIETAELGTFLKEAKKVKVSKKKTNA